MRNRVTTGGCRLIRGILVTINATLSDSYSLVYVYIANIRTFKLSKCPLASSTEFAGITKFNESHRIILADLSDSGSKIPWWVTNYEND